MLKESPLKDKLKEVGIVKYDKAEPEIYDYLSFGVENARINAKNINSEVINDADCQTDESQPYKLNPYTNFYELLDEIDLFLLEVKFVEDFAKIKTGYLFFCDKEITNVDLTDKEQCKLWCEFKALYEKYLLPNAKFAETWRAKASENLANDALFLEADIDNFYYQNQ